MIVKNDVLVTDKTRPEYWYCSVKYFCPFLVVKDVQIILSFYYGKKKERKKKETHRDKVTKETKEPKKN